MPLSMRVAPVDERCINPIGFRREPTAHSGTLVRHGAGIRIERSDGRAVLFPLSGAVTEFEVDELRDLRHVELPAALTDDASKAVVRIVLNLAAAGVPVLAAPSPGLLEAFDPDLAKLLTSSSAEALRERLPRETYSIRLRRHALLRYGTKARWRDLAGAGRLPLWNRPKVSVVLCTRRVDMVPFALHQVLQQRGVELEVLLTLHGIAAAELRRSHPALETPAHVTVLEVPASVPLGEVLNHAAARAGGSYVAKMDDDDWYGPDHLADLVLSQLYSGAELVGTDTEFVYLQEHDSTVRLWSDNTESPTHLTDRGLVSGGSTLITRNMLEALGGYRLVPLFEDSELCSAVRSAGGTVYRQHGLNYLYRRRPPAEHTWQVPTTWFLRERVPEWPGLFMNDLMLA
ncbi:glycosyltransferase [Dactylosporangium sp. NPDC049525]|uniref:glycosyltransferase family 2 protein n=1 Tax=Dactylosporangium sp. NPDC049525 TaxID=3154730 RepID=UPI003444AC76